MGQTINALADANLSIAKGEFICLIGASGCGKSTLLRIMAGFEQPSTGEALMWGKPNRETRAQPIQPFNQPDVQLAKELAKKAMSAAGGQTQAGAGADLVRVDNKNELSRAVKQWLSSVKPGDYISIQAYLNPTSETSSALQQIRTNLRDRTRVATTLGFGPRFLHSTGQLHKGGPNTGVFLQIVDEPTEELPVPETNYSFAQLIRAQAEGDYQALHQRGRRVLRVHLGQDSASGLRQIEETLGA